MIGVGQVWQTVSPYGRHSVVVLVVQKASVDSWNILILDGEWIQANKTSRSGECVPSVYEYWICYSDDATRLA